MDTYKAVVKFSKDASKMTSNIAVILETKSVKFNNLRKACIQEIHALGSTLPKSLVHKIQPTKSLHEMLDVLAMSPYWNWFDTRLLQALVSASGSPEAEEWLESFKATFYAKKIFELIPYISIKPFNQSTCLIEKFNKNPKELTISELLEHKYKLEHEVLDIDEGELVLSCIKTGCIELTWQITRELVYRAYTSMKRKQDELSSLAVKSLVCKVADEYAGLPILWRGQEVGEVGPIEPLPEHVRQEPYSLPQGFHWVTLSSSNIKEIVNFSKKHNDLIYTDIMVKHKFTHPHTRNEWRFGIRTTKGKLVGLMLASYSHICIGKAVVVFVSGDMMYHKKYKNNRLPYMLIKELMRRANLNKINQLLMSSNSLVMPATTVVQWVYWFDHPTSSQKLPSSPRTPGWRRMTSEDVPSALALINKWSSQFEIRQIFTSEEEFAHAFLLPLWTVTYIVKDKNNGITDLISYMYTPSSIVPPNAIIFSVVASTRSSVKQLIIDALVCEKENGATSAFIPQFIM